MKNILKNIIKTRKLETEWSANFIIDGIIRNNTAPVIHVYAYKEFDELKEKENKYCYYITCITSFSIMLIALLCYISLLDIDDTTFNRIIAIIITSSVIGFSYASFF